MISVRNLSFAYPGAAAPAVRDVSFEIAAGEIFGFLGPSGAGKSTTQKLLIGLLRGYAGEVSVLGSAPAAQGGDFYERIGVSFETPNHFLKLTGRENLAYFGALYAAPACAPQALLELVGLGDDGAMPVGQYSKGMRNRLSVARALVHDPPLLFLDEPTAGLDPVSARRIKDIVRDQQGRGKTIFLTTHDMSVADELCDRIAFIVEGTLRAVDSPRALKLRYGERAVRVEHRDGDGVVRKDDFPLGGLADDARFQAVLRAGRVETLHSREATLAQIFIEVTGRELQ